MRLNADFLRAWIGPRGRQIAMTGSWSLIAKACGALNLFVSMPFLLHALGPTLFGAWTTLVSFITFAAFLDFGLGNGAMNLIAGAHGRFAHGELAEIVRSSMRALLWIAAGLAVVAAIALQVVPWYLLLGLEPRMAHESLLACSAILASIVLAVPLNLALRAQLGIGDAQQGYALIAAGQLAACAATITASLAGASFVALVAFSVLIPSLASLANTILLFRAPFMRLAKTARPALSGIDRRIRREGFLFFTLQTAAALSFAVDLPLISSMIGPDQAGEYAVAQRLFSLVPLLLGLIWTPLWPAYRRALAARDHAWVTRTLKTSTLSAGVLAILASVLLFVCFEPITAVWMRHAFELPLGLVAGFAAWAVVDVLGSAYGTFLNAASAFRFLIITACVSSVVGVTIKILLVTHGNYQLFPWVTLFCFLVIDFLPLLLLFPYLMRGILQRTY